MKKINLTRTPKLQNGAGLGAIIFNVGLLIFIGFMVSKVAVFYIDNNTINNSLQDLKDVPHISKKSRGEVVEILRKKLQTNNLELNKDEIYVEKRTDRMEVSIIYERRVNMFKNLDVVVSFENYFQTVNN